MRILGLCLVLGLTGCANVCWGPFGGDCAEPYLVSDSGKKLQIYTDSATVLPRKTAEFKAKGGKKPYRFSLREGDGEVDRTTGVYTADNNLGRTIVRVTDDKDDIAEAVILVVDPDDEEPRW